MRVGICTGGGDCPGLNAVIRAMVKHGIRNYGMEPIGIFDCFEGLLARPLRYKSMALEDVSEILARGGTILGSSNKGNAFSGAEGENRRKKVVEGFRSLDLDALIVIGGEGTQNMSRQLANDIPLVAVPKTIDNDLPGTEQTIGFATSVDFVADSLMRLKTTAESHDRVMVMEVMGRDSGYIALHGGIAGGANIVLVPEIPFDFKAIDRKIQSRKKMGKNFSLIVVSEGARAINQNTVYQPSSDGKRILGGIGKVVASELASSTKIETRVTVLGHLQRGGGPNAFDRILATRFAIRAIDLVAQKRFSELVVIQDGKIDNISLLDLSNKRRSLNLDNDILLAAEAIGICLGR